MGGPNRPFRCDDNGYWVPFSWSRLQDIYGSFESYETRFMDAVDRLVAERWVVPEDGERIRQEFHEQYSGGAAHLRNAR
jgi:predicted DNA-binding ArsR family transcriptional regulator